MTVVTVVTLVTLVRVGKEVTLVIVVTVVTVVTKKQFFLKTTFFSPKKSQTKTFAKLNHQKSQNVTKLRTQNMTKL